MRVAYNGLFRGRLVGTGRYTDELLRASAALERAADLPPVGWRVGRLADESVGPLDVTPRDFVERAIAPPIPVRGENPIKLWFEQRGFPAFAADQDAELVHYPYFAAPLRSPAPLVVTAHDLIPLILPEYRGSPLVRAYMQLQVVTVRRARLILTDSNASRHDVVNVLDVPRQKVRVIPLAADRRYRPAPPEEVAAVRTKLRLPERFVLYNGGLDARKNVTRLLLAYARARASHGVSEPLAITGNPDQRGSLFPPLRPLVEQLGLERHVRFVGLARDEIVALYSGCSLFVYPSRYEGFGLPVLEAMACGAPVACSNVSSLPEVAGDAAILFDPDDEAQMAEAIAVGLGDGELREKGLARAAEFTWEKTAAATLQAYRDALEA
jgi:glycosyltransferase involved in cell wall biosynthesis